MGLFDIFKKDTKIETQDEQVKRVIVQFEAKGTSGTEIYGGYIEEEYLDALSGNKKAEIYDKMRRGESQVKMVTSAVKNPIKQANWFVKPGEETQRQIYMSQFIEHVLFNDLDKPWMEKLHEILSCVDFGYSLFEATHKIVKGHKKFGTYIGFQELGWRSQKTIERWNISKEDGSLVSVDQYAYGDLSNKQKSMDAKFLYNFTIDQEGSNFEGISMLRPCYGAWFRKSHFLKLLAVGIEKFSVNTPVGKVPDGKFGGEEYKRFTEVLEAYTSHHKQWITLPSGWEIEFLESKFEPEKTRNAINEENKEIVKAFLANFLELGLGSTSGSYSLSFDLSDFFLGGIEHLAKTICLVFNKKIIPDLIKQNFGPQDVYPELSYSGISDKVGEEFARMMNSFVTSGIIVPDLKLEEEMRRRIGLPDVSTDDQRPYEKPQASMFAEKKSEESVEFKEKTPRTIIKDASDELRSRMKESLKKMGRSMIDEIIGAYRYLPESQYSKALDAKFSGSLVYRDELREIMSDLAARAITTAAKEVPMKKRVAMAESLAGIAFGKSSFDKLPKKIQTNINTRLGLIVESQKADMEKNISFQFIGSVGTTDSEKILRADLEGALDKYVDSASVTAAAGNTASYIVNDTRKAYFFEPEVLEEVQAFEFVNGDPVSDICSDLAGRVFAKDDPDAERYMPPLHHNCKSYIVPILVGEKVKIDKEGLKPSSPDLESSITLSE